MSFISIQYHIIFIVFCFISNQMEFKEKPSTLVCYVCGRQFGSKSLQIHLKSCYQKFSLVQNQKQKKDRVALPNQPAFLKQVLSGNKQKITEYNQEATKIHKYHVLPSCKYCKRTFNQESLKVHEKVCLKTSKNMDNSCMEKQTKTQELQDIKKPRVLVCCICGREFGLTSLKIHYPQCEIKFRTQEMVKVKSERREAPSFTEQELSLINNKIDWTTQDIEQFNKKASSHFKDKGMVHCNNCNRKFMPEPYKRHLKNCQLINGKNVQEEQKNISKEQVQIKKPKVLMCHICGRQFGLTSLTIHQKTCRTKFINNQKKKVKSQRKTLPQIPQDTCLRFNFQKMEQWSTQLIEEYNKIANEIYRNESMFQCPFCHRKFIQQSFEKHRNYCEKNSKKEEAKEELKQSQPIKRNQQIIKTLPEVKQAKKQQIQVEPQGKIFQKDTIKQQPEQLEQTREIIKQKAQIQSKSDAINQSIIINKQLLSLPQQNRKAIIDKTQPKQSIANQDQNQFINQQNKSQKIPMKNQSISLEQSLQLSPCQKCGRKFLPERLVKHQPICREKKKDLPNNTQQTNKKIEENQITTIQKDEPHTRRQSIKKQPQIVQSKKQTNNQSDKIQSIQPQADKIERYQEKNDQMGPIGHSKLLVPCRKCGRRFLQGRLQKHEQCCKGKASNQSQNANVLSKTPITKQSKPCQPSPEKNKIVQKQINQQLRNQEKKQTIIAGQDQHQEFQPAQLKPCEKCGRKFKIDRLQIHFNVCKGNQKKQMNPKLLQKQQQKSKTLQVIRKTKENFFKMVEDIKGKKIRQEQIDQQLQVELQIFDNQPTNRILNKKKNNQIREIEPIKGKRQGHLKQSKNINQAEFQSISKWNKSKDVKGFARHDKKPQLLPQI